MLHNNRMRELYKSNFTIQPTMKARRFKNPFLLQSSQVLLSNILQAQTKSATATSTVKSTIPQTSANTSKNDTSSILKSETTKSDNVKKERAKIASDKKKADAKTASDKAKADEIYKKFNKSVADQKARDKAKKDAKELADYLKRDEAEKVREEKEEAKKAKAKSESGGVKVPSGGGGGGGKKTPAKKPTVAPTKKPTVTPTKPTVAPTKKPTVTLPSKKPTSTKTTVPKETDSTASLNANKNDMSLPELNRKRASIIINKQTDMIALKILNEITDEASKPPPYQPYLRADGTRQEPGSELERESDAYRIWYKSYGKLWLQREAKKSQLKQNIQQRDAELKANTLKLQHNKESTQTTNKNVFIVSNSETHIPVIKAEITRLRKVVSDDPSDTKAKASLDKGVALLKTRNAEKLKLSKSFIEAVKERNASAVSNGVSSADFKAKSKIVEGLIDKLHSYDKVTPSVAKNHKDHKLPDPFGSKEGSTTKLPVSGGGTSSAGTGGSLRGGGN